MSYATPTRNQGGRPPKVRQPLDVDVTYSIDLEGLLQQKMQREQRTISWREVAEVARVPRARLDQIKKGACDRLYLAELIQLAIYFGRTLEEMVEVSWPEYST